MQYENLFKVIGVVHVILASLKSSSAAQTALKMASGTSSSRNSTSTHEHMAKTMHKKISMQANTNKN